MAFETRGQNPENERTERYGYRGTDYITRKQNQDIQGELDSAQSSILAPWAAGLGVIGLGAMILGTPLARGNIVSNLLHFLGHGRQIRVPIKGAVNVGKASPTGGDAGIRSVLDAVWNVKQNRLQLESIDLIEDAVAADHLLGSVSHTQTREFLQDRLTEFFHRRNVSRGGNTGYFAHDLKRITIDEVLAEQEVWTKLISTNKWTALKKARDKGIVKGDYVLDRKVFSNREGYLRDLRAGYHVSRRLDMFGQGAVAQSLAGSNVGVARLAADKQFSGTRYFIGGSTYGFEGATLTPKLLQTNQKLRLAGDPLSVVAAAREGRLETNVQPRGLLGSTPRFAGLQKKFGIGATYATRPSHLERFVINPFRRLRAISSGQGTVFKVGHRYSDETTGRAAGEVVLGGQAPELFGSTSRVINSVEGGRAPIEYATLSFWDKVKVSLDLHPELKVVKQSAATGAAKDPTRILTNNDLVIPLPSGGISGLGLQMAKGSKPAGLRGDMLTKAGDISPGLRAAYYNVEKGVAKGFKDFLNYAYYRTVNLSSESMLGIGFLPGKTAIGSAARLGAIPVAYEAGRQAINYLDYEIENVTGFSPVKGIASLYTSARVGLQDLRESLGIQQSLDYMEQNFPGIINSPISFLMRNLIAPGAALLGAKNPRVGAAIAGGIIAAVGGIEPNQRAQDLSDIYEGKAKVPVRQGAFWGLGYTPWTGGRILRFDHSWYHKLTSGASTAGIYGNEQEYWNYHANVFGVPFPTPRNLFGVSNLLNPYRLEEMHADTRPYPTTGRIFEEFPIIGPALAATLGQVIKPERRQGLGEMPLVKAGLVDRGLTPSAARMLGLPELMASSHEYDYPSDPISRITKQAAVAAEPMGVYKFLIEYVGAEFGLGEGERTTVADSTNIGSLGRGFYGLGLGGALGQTEFLRRFFLSDYSLPNKMRGQLNPLPNALPRWLPGLYSEEGGDRGYFLDFTRGDAYTKIEGGEDRLPGKGYESLTGATEYGPVERLEILADVAPYSAAFRKYKRIVEGMRLSEDNQKRVERILAQREQVVNYRSDYPRYEDQLIELNEGVRQQGTIYPLLRKAYDFVTHDVLAEMPVIGTKLAPFRNEIEQYRREVIEGAYFASWYDPYGSIIRPAAANIAYSNPIMATVKGGILGAIVASPAAKFLNPLKFTHNQIGRTATAGAVGGTILSGGRTLVADQEDIPAYRRAEIAQSIYTDRLSYLKSRIWEEEAREMGQPELANQFALQSKRTMLGANNALFARSALPTSSDRRFFQAFSLTEGPQRDKLMSVLPGHYQETLQAVWTHTFSSRDQADAAATEYFNNHPAPNSDFMGWHPSVPMQATKIKLTTDGLGGDSDFLHRYGFYDSQVTELKHRIPDLWDQQVVYDTPTNFSNFQDLLDSKRERLQKSIRDSNKYRHRTNSTPFRVNSQYDIEIDASSQTTYYLQDLMR